MFLKGITCEGDSRVSYLSRLIHVFATQTENWMVFFGVFFFLYDHPISGDLEE